jgi:hypothetical protein
MQTALSRTETESVDCDERARTALMHATKRVGGPYGAIADRLADVLRDFCALKMRGLNATDFGHIALCVNGVLADLSDSGVTDIAHVRRMRSLKDREDDRLMDLHHIDGPHAVSRRELAAGFREAAAWNMAAALLEERLDREERRNAARTIDRLRETGRSA